jgi:hypothetical protein
MIPFIARINVRHGSRQFRLWIPLALVWLLLLPIVLVLLPFFVLICVIGRVNPFVALGALWEILCGTRGAEVEFGDLGTAVSIYVF